EAERVVVVQRAHGDAGAVAELADLQQGLGAHGGCRGAGVRAARTVPRRFGRDARTSRSVRCKTLRDVSRCAAPRAFERESREAAPVAARRAQASRALARRRAATGGPSEGPWPPPRLSPSSPLWSSARAPRRSPPPTS